MSLPNGMFGRRFVVDPDSGTCTFVADPYVHVKPDSWLMFQLPEIERRLLKLFKRLWPDRDDSNSIKVVAVMPTVSLQTRLEFGNTVDGAAVFCVDRIALYPRFELTNDNEEMKEKMRNVGIKQVFWTEGVTDPETYEERKHCFLQTDFGARFSGLVKHTVLHYMKKHHATKMISFWTRARPPGMPDGLNRMSDNPMCFKDTLRMFDELCDEVVTEHVNHFLY